MHTRLSRARLALSLAAGISAILSSVAPAQRVAAAAAPSPTPAPSASANAAGADPNGGKYPTPLHGNPWTSAVPQGSGGYQPGQSSERPQLETSTTQVFQNADGTNTAHVFSSPVNFQDTTGAWKHIDPSIVTKGDGKLHNAGGPNDVQLASSSSEAQLLTMSRGGVSVGFGAPLGARANVPASVGGSAVSYPNLIGGADLEYRLTAHTAKELITLYAPPPGSGPLQFTFPLHVTGGLTPSTLPDGGIGFSDAHGVLQFKLPVGTMNDSSPRDASGHVPTSPVLYTLAPDHSTVTVSADRSWLNDPARVYPVVVDPVVVDEGDGAPHMDAFVESSYPTSKFPYVWDGNSGHYVEDLGYWSTTGTNQAYLQYDSTAFMGKRIVSGIWKGTFYAVGTGASYNMHPVSSTWDSSTLTWNTKPTIRAEYTGGTATTGAQQAVDISSWVTSWASGSWTMAGLMFDENGNGSSTYFKELAADEDGPSTASYLEVTFEGYAVNYGFAYSDADPPVDVAHPSFRGVTANTAFTLPVYVENHGSDAWPGPDASPAGVYKLSYHIYDSAGTTQVTWDGVRTVVPNGGVFPGQGFWLQANVTAPATTGSYTIKFDMVEEGTAWFSSWGVSMAPFKLLVAPAPGLGATPASGATITTNPPAVTVSTTGCSGLTPACLDRFELSNRSDFGVVLASTGAGYSSATSWTIPSGSLQLGVQYWWRVFGADSRGASTPPSSSTFTIANVPSAPTGVNGTTPVAGQVTVGWTTPASTGGTAITGYVITPYIGQVAQATSTAGASATSAVLTTLTNGTAYTFTVAATNAMGTGPVGSSTIPATPHGVPSQVTGATAMSGMRVVILSWTAPSANGSPITQYKVTPNDNGTPLTTITFSSTATTEVVTGLTNGHTYTFTVVASNADGDGPASAATTGVVPGGSPSSAISVDKGTGIYPRGSMITVTDNLSSLSGTARSGVTVDLPLPSAFNGLGSAITIAGAPCATPYTCTTTATDVKIQGLTAPATGSVAVTVTLVAIGQDRQCSTSSLNAMSTDTRGAYTSVPVSVCDSGLGIQKWRSLVSSGIGALGSASVDVADGNLVIQQADSTPIPLHGGLALDVHRTYNSQDSLGLGISSPLGAGWVTSYVDTPATTNLVALAVSSGEGFATGMPVTGVDAGGTRVVMSPSTINSPVDVTGLTASSVLATLLPTGSATSLHLDTGYSRLCVDRTYAPPAGFHLGMWRYVETTTSSCTGLTGATTRVLGFAVETPSRVRSEYSWEGHLLNVRDAAGNEVGFTYANGPVARPSLGNLTQVAETATGRALTFAYASGTVTITDAATRATVYHLDAATPAHLTSVVNPGGGTLSYTYATTCGGSADQLCTAKDLRGNTWQVSYAAAALGPARVATTTDRRNTATTYTYSSTPDLVTADTGSGSAGQRRRFQAIDGAGRVGELDEGSGSDVYLRQTLFTWDAAGAPCRQPDAAVDNNLCHETRLALNGGATPNRTTDWVFGDEGQLLQQQDTDSPQNLTDTGGYVERYFEAGGTVASYTDTIGGAGLPTSTTQAGGRLDAGSLFAVVDRTQELSPNGNAAGSGYAAFLTTTKVDNAAVAPSVAVAGTVCSNPGTPTTNTGLACEQDAPAVDGTSAAVTKTTYNAKGERATLTTPKMNAESLPGTYTYTYYADTAKDSTNTTSAGGWLQAITDPLPVTTPDTPHFVAFEYDRAGNQQRVWDRVATHGHTASEWNSGTATPANTPYVETFRGTASAPWRYVTSISDQLGHTTQTTVDANGNVLTVRSPRGVLANNSSYDVTATYNENDQQLTKQQPAELAAGKHSSVIYDTFGNATATTDPNGNVTTTSYDSVNRATGHAFTRGPWDANVAPASCGQSAAGDSPIPTGRIICHSSQVYDGVDNVTSSTDPAGATTSVQYDAVHRAINSWAPRYDGTYTTLHTQTYYDAYGNVTDVCSPRQFTDSGSGCVAGGPNTYGVHRTWVPGNKLSAETTYSWNSAQAATAVTTQHVYDADGNERATTDGNGHQSSAAFDVLDRRTAASTPIATGISATTSYDYDPAGRVTTVERPTGPISAATLTYDASSYDAAGHLVDTVTDSSTKDVASAGATDGANQLNLRTRRYYDADGNVVATIDPRGLDVSTVLSQFMTWVSYDADGRPVARYTPRYDTTPNSAYGQMGTSGYTAAQQDQCTTGNRPAAVTGAPTYPASIAVCKTGMTYDANGQVTRVTLPTTTATATNRYIDYTFTDDGKPFTTVSPSPATAGQRITSNTAYYDADGRQVKTVDANGNATAQTYFQDGLVATTVDPPYGSLTHVSTTSYNANGQPTQATNGAGDPTTTTYTPNGWTWTITDGNGNISKYIRDGAGNVTTAYSPNANAYDTSNSQGIPTYTAYYWDNTPYYSAQPVVVPSSGAATQRLTEYALAGDGQKVSQHVWQTTGANLTSEGTGPTQGDGLTQSFTYYPNGKAKQETGRDAGAHTITRGYDAAGNLTSALDTTNNVSVGATYYLDGLVRTANDGSRTGQFSYDGLGSRAVDVDVNSSSQVAEQANITLYNDAELSATMYNDQVAPTASAPTTRVYDNAGQVTLETLSNQQLNRYNWNPDGTLGQIAVQKDTSNTLGTWLYNYDGAKRLINSSFNGLNTVGVATPYAFTYGYDRGGRLLSYNFSSYYQGQNTSQTQNIPYDHDGNRTSYTDYSSGYPTGYTYRADDSMNTSYSRGVTYTSVYDPVGRVIGDGCSTYTFDGFDRQSGSAAGAGRNTNCGPDPGATTYQYDGLDRRRVSTTSAGSTAIDYQGMGSSVEVEQKPSSAITLYQLDDKGQALGAVNSAGKKEWFAYDQQGSLGVALDANRAIQCNLRLDPFGSVMSGQSTGNPCNGGSTISDLIYHGGRRDAATGQYQLGSRSLDPSRAAFLSPDSYRFGSPAADQGLGNDPSTSNRYLYVNSDPLNLADPDGHNPCASEGGGCTASENKTLAASDRGQAITWTPGNPYHDQAPRSVSSHRLWSLNGGGVTAQEWGYIRATTAISVRAHAAQALEQEAHRQAWQAAQAKQDDHWYSGVCLRNPFGGNNDNGGCHTNLSTKQGAVAVAAVAVTAGAAACVAATAGICSGAAAGAEGSLAGSLGGEAAVSTGVEATTVEAGAAATAETGSVAADSGASTISNVTTNQAAGKAFEETTAARLGESGWNIIGTQVRVTTSLGTRITDILAERGGSLVGFETKFGGSRYLASQVAKDQWISNVGGRLTDGSFVQFPTVLIRG